MTSCQNFKIWELHIYLLSCKFELVVVVVSFTPTPSSTQGPPRIHRVCNKKKCNSGVSNPTGQALFWFVKENHNKANNAIAESRTPHLPLYKAQSNQQVTTSLVFWMGKYSIHTLQYAISFTTTRPSQSICQWMFSQPPPPPQSPSSGRHS